MMSESAEQELQNQPVQFQTYPSLIRDRKRSTKLAVKAESPTPECTAAVPHDSEQEDQVKGKEPKESAAVVLADLDKN